MQTNFKNKKKKLQSLIKANCAPDARVAVAVAVDCDVDVDVDVVAVAYQNLWPTENSQHLHAATHT